MHRRHFIKATGISIAGSLIADFATAGGRKNYALEMPGMVEIKWRLDQQIVDFDWS